MAIEVLRMDERDTAVGFKKPRWEISKRKSHAGSLESSNVGFQPSDNRDLFFRLRVEKESTTEPVAFSICAMAHDNPTPIMEPESAAQSIRALASGADILINIHE